MKAHEFDRIIQKFRMQTRHGRDLLAWFVHDGRVITRTRRSKGSGDLPFNLIRQQLQLNEEQLQGVISCSVEYDDYVAILRRKGLI